MTELTGPPQPTTPNLPAIPAATENHLPAPGEWAMIMQMSEMLAGSDLVPAAYRRKPANIVLASLAGRPFGWDPTMSMRSFHIIEGTPSLKPGDAGLDPPGRAFGHR